MIYYPALQRNNKGRAVNGALFGLNHYVPPYFMYTNSEGSALV